MSRNRGMMPMLVDARADAPDEARCLELGHRPPAAGRELCQEALVLDAGAVIHVVEVVDDREVVARQTQPELALLVGPHDAVVGVVEDHLEGRRRPPRASPSKSGSWDALSQRPILVDSTYSCARVVAQPGAGAQLRQAAAVPGRGVEVADAAVPGRLDGAERVLLGHLVEQLAYEAPPRPSWVTATPVRPTSRVALDPCRSSWLT